MQNINDYDLNTFKRVLLEEANAINTLAAGIGQEHSDLLKMCEDCKGKIVLTGMGKSGHVARKISATMASLGCPSFFLHPAEAAHGDLGMVQREDLLIMVSKSGETEEIIQLINSLKIIGCNLVGLFCTKGSTLERYCDLTIILPCEKEACINNLAPTTSTTLTMAYGDALAVELSERKGFKKRDFALFHPKGSLGKQLLLTVKNLVDSDAPTMSVMPDETVKNVLWNITKNRLGAVAVVDENINLVGLISDGDIRRGLESNESFLNLTAKDIMTRSPKTASGDMLAAEALKMMNKNKISVLPIVDKTKFIGLVSFHDVVKAGVSGGIQ